jgi:hypothetical protein
VISQQHRLLDPQHLSPSRLLNVHAPSAGFHERLRRRG